MNITERDVIFTHEGDIVYDPLTVVSESNAPGSVTFTVRNMGDDAFDYLGLFIRPSSNLGPWDNPADYPPSTDYQDAIMWGEKASAGEGDGGFKVYFPADDLNTPIWISRTSGSSWVNRIKLGDIPSGGSATVRVDFIVPAGIDSRRLFVDLVVG